MQERTSVILIGATGHIGSWTHRCLVEQGFRVTACSRKKVELPPELAQHTDWQTIDLSDPVSLERAFGSQKHAFFIHLASEKVIGNAERDPARAIEVNVVGAAHVLAAAAAAGVHRGLFASTWAVYAPNNIFGQKYSEEDLLEPVTVYGTTKKIGEELCRTYVKKGAIPNLSVFRFFNTVGGAAYEGAIEQQGFFNYVNQAIKNSTAVNIAGKDFSTPDGSCFRDFIDVRDVANAIVSMVESTTVPGVFNIGSGNAHSLMEVVDIFESVAGTHIQRNITEQRPGDPSYVCASTEKVKEDLGFTIKYDLKDMVASTMGI